MSVKNMDQIFSALDEYKFEFKDLQSSLKCTKCSKILNNAKQVPCGCRLCDKCLVELIDTGVKSCPGMTDFCKEASLSDSQVDYSTNRDISNISVQCPLMCSHEDKLFNMPEHLAGCPKKGIQCVFHSFGCNKKNLLVENFEDHLLSDYYGHMKKLVDTIEDLKHENEALNNENKLLNKKIDFFHKENQIEFDDIFALIKESGRVFKTITKFDERKQNKEIVFTNYFYGKRYPYKMSLTIYLNGFCGKGTQLSICFFVWHDARNPGFQWPFKATVTINIFNKDSSKTQSKHVEIQQPENHYFGYNPKHFTSKQYSEIFHFEYSDLTAANLLEHDVMDIECIVTDD